MILQPQQQNIVKPLMGLDAQYTANPTTPKANKIEQPNPE